MNIGTIVTQALMRAGLSISDHAFRELGTQMLDEVIQELWESKLWNFRRSQFWIETQANVSEYSLHKLVDGVDSIVQNTMRGSDPVRRLYYKPASEFHRTHSFSLSSGTPQEYREGETRGIETQVSASSTITVSSSEANQTAGTIAVVYGSRRMILTGATITYDDLGNWIRIGTDLKRYMIVKYESSTQFLVHDPYEGTTNATASYALGDVNQKVTVQGYNDDNVIIEEEIELNGATGVTTTTSFQSVIRITKSAKTRGYITATSNGALITNLILDPGETEAEYETVHLYPIPTETELISYWAYSQHPHLYKPTAAPWFPNRFHGLLVLELFIKLQSEWNLKEVPQEVYRRRDKWEQRLIAFDNDTSNWTIQQETERDSERPVNTNLPTNFGRDAYDEW